MIRTLIVQFTYKLHCTCKDQEMQTYPLPPLFGNSSWKPGHCLKGIIPLPNKAHRTVSVKEHVKYCIISQYIKTLFV